MSYAKLSIIAFLLALVFLVRADSLVIPIPVTLDGQPLGDLNAQLSDGSLAAVEFTHLRARLEETLSPTQFAKLPGTDVAWVTPAQLEAAGVSVQFDVANLSLHLAVLPQYRKLHELRLIGVPDVHAERVVRPSEFSAYLNVRGGVDYRQGGRTGESMFGQPRFDFENAFNFKGWVLENETVVNPSLDKAWEKRDTRLVFDQPEQRLRWTAGDLNYPVVGFQQFIPMAGVSLHRENRLQPYRIITPLGQTAFHLKQDSKVEVLVNGQTVRTLQLPAGPHQISDFPLTGGANDVVLRITDSVGRVEYIKATFYYDTSLLKAGESQFNAAIGFPSNPQPDEPCYTYKIEPAVSAFYRRGLSDRLTLGVNAQAIETGQHLGTEAAIGAPIGVFGLDLALSRDHSFGLGHAEQVRYKYYLPAQGPFTHGVLSFSLRHTSEGYGLGSPFFPSNWFRDETWDWQVSLVTGLGDHIMAGVAYGERTHHENRQVKTLSLNCGYHRRRLSAQVTAQHLSGPAHTAEWSIYLTMTLHLSRTMTAFSGYDTASHSARAELQYTPPINVESVGGVLGVHTTPDTYDVYGNVRYFGRRAELWLGQDVLDSGETWTSLRWGTALVYADGLFGISRPVTDSFAIFHSTGALRDAGGVGVQPQYDRYTAQESWLGPAVMPQLTSYYNTHVWVEPRRPDAELDPGESNLLLKPTYRSGTVVRLGSQAVSTIIVPLVWADGKPAALQFGTATSTDGTSVEFVTDREGVAYFHGLSPGSYRAVLITHPDTPFIISIPQSDQPEVRLDAIRIPTSE